MFMAKKKSENKLSLLKTKDAKLRTLAKKLAVIAKEKEVVRKKLLVTAGELRGRAKELAIIAKEKEKNRLKLQEINNKISISELRYRRLFETAQDGILLIDFKTGMILDVNQFLIDLLDYSKKDFLGKHLWQVGVFKDIAASKQNFLTLQKKRYVRFDDLPLETRKGKKIDVEFVANAYGVGDVTIVQCNIRDITEQKNSVIV
jgi:PAS domain S-box-containing protein